MITFIIPTIGRDTLLKSIKSIENQTNNNWKAIVIFDGIKNNINISNEKIKIIEIPKNGKGRNSAGNVRNEGMKYVDTEWIGFLDDDDTLSNRYVENFYSEIKNYPKIDVLIFRMYNKIDNLILPELNTDNFYMNHVGISFVLKTEIFKRGLKFIPSSVEDYNYLNLIRKNNYKIMISPYITYFVGGDELYDKQLGKRVFCNTIEYFSEEINIIKILYIIILILINILFVKNHIIKPCIIILGILLITKLNSSTSSSLYG